MKTELTKAQAEALAALINRLRRDWDQPGIMAALGEARTIAPAWDVAVAAIKAARDPKNRTPVVITLEGPHWREAEHQPRYRTPDRGETCSTCYQRRDVCRSRWETDHEFVPLARVVAGPHTPTEDYRAAKAALRPKHTTTTEGDAS